MLGAYWIGLAGITTSCGGVGTLKPMLTLTCATPGAATLATIAHAQMATMTRRSIGTSRTESCRFRANDWLDLGVRFCPLLRGSSKRAQDHHVVVGFSLYVKRSGA